MHMAAQRRIRKKDTVRTGLTTWHLYVPALIQLCRVDRDRFDHSSRLDVRVLHDWWSVVGRAVKLRTRSE